MSKALERRRILEYAKLVGSVREACQVFGISRTIFYRWQKRFEAFGMAGLEDQKPKNTQKPNKVDKTTERAILDQIVKTPKDGPRQISFTLNHNGYSVGETGVYRVMQRNGLNTRALRVAFAKSHARQRSDIKQLTKLDIKLKKPENQIPGFLVMETLRAWQPCKGHNKVYYYAIYDVHSHWGLIKLFSDKSSINIAEIYALRIAPLMKIFKLPIKNVLSEQLEAYEDCWERRWQAEKAIARGRKASKFWELPANKNDLIQPLDQFIQTNLEAMDQAIIQRYECTTTGGKISFTELEQLMDTCMQHYNFKQSRNGQTPTETILNYLEGQGVDPETFPLWVYIRMV